MRGRKPNQTKLFPVVAPVVQDKRTESAPGGKNTATALLTRQTPFMP